MRIRAVQSADLPRLAALHTSAFPQSALTRLGSEAVRRYYDWLLTGPHQSTTLGAFVGDDLAGFGVGGTFNGAMTGFLRRNRGFLGARLISRPWLLASPLIRERAHRAWRLLTRRVSRAAAGRRSAADSPPAFAGPSPSPARSFGVLALAVDPSYRRHGVGRRLMDALDEAARQQGFSEMDLSVHPSNEGAVSFYERLGWERHPVREWRGVMRKRLT